MQAEPSSTSALLCNTKKAMIPGMNDKLHTEKTISNLGRLQANTWREVRGVNLKASGLELAE